MILKNFIIFELIKKIFFYIYVFLIRGFMGTFAYVLNDGFYSKFQQLKKIRKYFWIYIFNYMDRGKY
jgi:hypothetical protein